MKLDLPATINADGLLPFVSLLSSCRDRDEEVALNFSKLRRVTPAGLVALASVVNRWKREDRPVSIEGMAECAIKGYLQRMDLLKVCGWEAEENFTRRESSGRFVPVRPIIPPVDEMGNEMACCVAPGGEEYGDAMADIYDLTWYVLTETANNVLQHSAGKGYVAAQVTRQEGMVRLAMADNGRGILRSFQDVGLEWAERMDDASAIKKALESRVSSKGTPTNEGVGLTLIAGLARLSQAWLLIVSGKGVWRIGPNMEPVLTDLPADGYYQGTLIGLTFRQKPMSDFANLLTEAKEEAGLLLKNRIKGNFRV